MWRDGEATEGWIRVERGRVVDEGSGAPARAQPSALLDGVYDYHTHIGDAFLRGRRLPHSLDQLVRPPSGLKHRMLATAKPAQIVAGMRRALQEYAETGTRAVLDFREQGLAGVQLARKAFSSAPSRMPGLRLLGRPAAETDAEIEQLLSQADGIGIPSLRDVEPELAHRVATACRRVGRPLALHLSEARREPVEDALALAPDLLVHLVHATPQDLRRVQDAAICVAVCPSSNAFFRLRAPIQALHRAGIAFHFGTDNAMLGGRSVVAEAARAHALAPQVPDAVLLAGLTRPIEKGIKRLAEVSSEPGRAPQRVIVLPLRNGRVRWAAPPRVAAR